MDPVTQSEVDARGEEIFAIVDAKKVSPDAGVEGQPFDYSASHTRQRQWPLVRKTGRPITQAEVDDALDD